MRTRRDVFRSGLALSALGIASPALTASARAASRGGYKALVCVFLEGGLDGYDLLVPQDERAHRRWTSVRAPLLSGFDERHDRRDRAALLPVGRDGEGAPYALPPEMPGTARAVSEGRAAVVANVGPLLAPMTRRGLEKRDALVPPQLYSHSDQQRYWRSLVPVTGATSGWLGRLSDAASEAPGGDFSAIAALRDVGLLSRKSGQPLVVGGTKVKSPLGSNSDLERLMADHMASERTAPANLLAADFEAQQRRAVRVQRQLIDLFAEADAAEAVAVPKSDIGTAFGIVANMIASRAETGATRQVFAINQGGYDTHQNQGNRLPGLLSSLDKAVTRFQDWLRANDLADAVTTFTASDFGRTLVPNRSGTDHGWGGHALVWGGAVRPGIHGVVPPPETGHERDAGRGRLVPSYAVEQLGVPLARWFGVPDADMDEVFPLMDRFDADALGLMRG